MLNSLLEASHSSFTAYTLINLPTSTVLTVLTRTCLSSLFSSAVPVAGVTWTSTD